MRMPEILQGHSLTVKEQIRPDSMSISWKADDLSTATMTLDESQPAVELGEWIRIWTPSGEPLVMYVREKQTNHTEKSIQLTLEHTFGLLEEMIMFEEITPESMGGGSTVSAAAAIQYILGKQTETIWVYGSCDFQDAQGWKFTNTTVKSALTDIREAIMDCQWEYDQTVYPFVLSLKQYPAASTMELRRNRNLDSLQISLDRGRMFTRAYPIGNKNLQLPEKYLERNTATWGVVAQTISDSSIDSVELLRAWAAAQLKKNAEPVITISISGADLSAGTGESLDKMIPGRLCRVPLPEYKDDSGDPLVVMQRLVEVSWRNCVEDPESVTISLANEHKTIQGILNENARGGGATGAKSHVKTGCDLNDHEDRIDTEEEISSQAGMYLDDYGYIQYSTNTKTMVGSRFLSLNDRMEMAVGTYNVDPTKLIEYPTKAGFPEVGQVGYFYGDASTNKVYTWKADSGLAAGGLYVELKLGEHGEGYYVKAGEIATYINNCGESISYINADHVNISATSTAHMLAGEVEYDANGRLMIKSAGGLYVRRTSGQTTVEVGVWDEGNLTGGVMVQKINGQTTTKVRGDKVVLGSDPSSSVTVDGSLGSENGMLWLKNATVIKGTAAGSAQVTINNGKVTAATHQSGTVTLTDTTTQGTNYENLTYGILRGMIKTATLNTSTNTLTLTKFNGETINFNKAADVEVSGWAREQFATDGTVRNSKVLEIPVSVDVNGETYSNTFYTGAFSASFVTGSTKIIDLWCGSRRVAVLRLQ